MWKKLVRMNAARQSATLSNGNDNSICMRMGPATHFCSVFSPVFVSICFFGTYVCATTNESECPRFSCGFIFHRYVLFVSRLSSLLFTNVCKRRLRPVWICAHGKAIRAPHDAYVECVQCVSVLNGSYTPYITRGIHKLYKHTYGWRKKNTRAHSLRKRALADVTYAQCLRKAILRGKKNYPFAKHSYIHKRKWVLLQLKNNGNELISAQYVCVCFW